MSQEPVWVTPEQIETLRDTCYTDAFQGFAQPRNDALTALMADTGLRVGEVVQIRVENLTDAYDRVMLKPEIQKSYNRQQQQLVRMELGKLVSDLPRTLKSYLDTRWKDSPYLFPSRKADDMSAQSVRNMVKKCAVEADIRPYRPDGTRAEPDSMHPHAFRHSIAYRMLEWDDEKYTLEDLQRRLRHKRRETTENTYSHFLVV